MVKQVSFVTRKLFALCTKACFYQAVQVQQI